MARESNDILPMMQFRQVRLELATGKWITCRKKLYTVEDALRYCDANQYKNAYVSVATWLRPYDIKQKPSMETHEFVGADLVCETDFTDKMEAFWQTEKVCDVLGHIGYHRLGFVETNRGYHVWVHDFREQTMGKFTHLEGNVDAPANWWLQQMKNVVFKLEKAGCRFDFNTSMDIMRIVRLPGSRHESGLLCRHSTDLYSLRPKGCAPVGVADDTIRLNGGEVRR